MSVDLEELAQLFAQEGAVVLLESQSKVHPWSTKSYLAALPEAVIKARGDRITMLKQGDRTVQHGSPWEVLQSFRKRHDDWLFGYLGYDLKNHLEELNSQNHDDVQAPDMYFMVPGFLLEVDRSTGRSKVLKGSLPENMSSDPRGKMGFNIGQMQYRTSKEKYLAMIDTSQQRIKEGEFYEINLSHQMSADFNGSAFELYRQMKNVGPVPFGAYMHFDDITVCSQSPERFLRKQGHTVFSQPIKGTSQRGESAVEDEKIKQQLQSDPKERAENLMIVDLVRNDLSRIASRGSVKVPELFSIQSFGTVHQMVSTVTADTAETDPVNILKACFPMGSMTGAPKIRAMKTIEELEDYRRGIYSGAVGYIKPDADFDFNVVIRSAIIRENRLYYSVGGAITSDSDPGKEWQETRLKAKALLDVDTRFEEA